MKKSILDTVQVMLYVTPIITVGKTEVNKSSFKVDTWLC